MPELDSDPHGRMMQLITGYWATQIVRGAAAVSLADHLADGPRSPEEIAADGPLHPDVALRFLRACAALELVAPEADGRFASTPLLATLRESAPGSLRSMALVQGAPGHWLPWGLFPDVLATGRYQTVAALGIEIFDHFAANPQESADFSRAMSGLTAMAARNVAAVIDTSRVEVAVDIGGAEGALLRTLLDADPRLRGLLFDRPEVVAGFSGGDGRIEVVGGDFFVEVPAGDLYLLKFILHDWDDASCIAILSACRKAARSGGRVAVIEMMLDEDGAGFAALMDMNMMALASGRERTFDQYRRLLEASGFVDVRATPTASPMTVIEAAAN